MYVLIDSPIVVDLPLVTDLASLTDGSLTPVCGDTAVSLSITQDYTTDYTVDELAWITMDSTTVTFDPTSLSDVGVYDLVLTFTLTDYEDTVASEDTTLALITVLHPCAYESEILVSTPSTADYSNEYVIGLSTAIRGTLPTMTDSASEDEDISYTCGDVQITGYTYLVNDVEEDFPEGIFVIETDEETNVPTGFSFESEDVRDVANYKVIVNYDLVEHPEVTLAYDLVEFVVTSYLDTCNEENVLVETTSSTFGYL